MVEDWSGVERNPGSDIETERQKTFSPVFPVIAPNRDMYSAPRVAGLRAESSRTAISLYSEPGAKLRPALIGRVAYMAMNSPEGTRLWTTETVPAEASMVAVRIVGASGN